MTNQLWRLTLSAVLLAASGCLSLGGVQRADTLGKGNFQVGIEPGVIGIGTPAGVGVLPQVDFSGRFGVTEGVDLGLRLGTTGLELQGKFLATTPGHKHVAVSIAPTIGGFFFGVFNYFALNVPVLIGIKFGPHELIFGPRVIAQFLTAAANVAGMSSGGIASAILPGLSVGFAAEAMEQFVLIPEFVLAVPVVGAFAVLNGMSTSAAANQVLPVFQFKLGLEFGRQKRQRPLTTEDVDAYRPPPPAPPPAPSNPGAPPVVPPPPPYSAPN